MEARSAIWTLTIICCLISESTELVLPSASWMAAGAARPLTTGSVTSRQLRSPSPGPTVTASSAPRERTKPASGGHQASSETAAAGRSTTAGGQRGPAGRDGRVRPHVMLVNRDGEPHSLAPVQALSAGRRPVLLMERPADGVRRRGRRSLLSPLAVGAGQVLVGLARGAEAPFILPATRLTASAFLVQFSEIGGRTTQVVATGDGGGSRGESHVTQGQAQNQEQTRQRQRQEPDQRLVHGQRLNHGNTEDQKSHGQGQETIRSLVSSEQGIHRYQAGAENTTQRTTALQSQRAAAGSDSGAEPVLADSDRLDGHRPTAGHSPVRSHHDQRQTPEATSSVTVTGSLQPRLRPAEPDQQPAYKYKVPDQAQGYNYETPGQTQGLSYEAPDQTQGNNYEAPNQSQGYDYDKPGQQQGYSYEMSNQLEVTITDLQTTQNSNVRLTGTNIFTAPHTHDIGGDISAAPAFHSNGIADSGPLAGSDAAQPARSSPGSPRNNLSQSVSNELAADGNIRAGRDRDQWLGGPVSNEWAGRRQAASSGQRPRPESTDVRGHPAPAASQTDSIRRPDAPSQLQPGRVRAVSDGLSSNPTLSAQQPANLNVVIPDLPSTARSGSGQAALGTNGGPPTADTGYQYDPPATTDGVYQYDPPSSSDAGYQYDPPVTDTGYQYNPATSTDSGYQYDSPSASSTGYQYNPPSVSETLYRYDPPATGESSINAITAPEFHVDHWHRPRPLSSLSHTNTSPSHPTAWRPMIRPPAAPPSTVRPGLPAVNLGPDTAQPELSSGDISPSTPRPHLPPAGLGSSTAHPDLHLAGGGSSTARPGLHAAGGGSSTARPGLHAAGEGSSAGRPQLTAADLSPSSAGPEFPAPRLDAAPSPRGLMWPVMDVLERTMAAHMVSAATVGEPDGVLVRHRGTAQPLQQQPRRRRRQAGRPGQHQTDMQHALYMVAALTGRTGTEPAEPGHDTPSVATRDVPLFQLPLQPAPDFWPRRGEEGQQTAATAVSADLASDAVSTADPASNAVSTADPASDAVSTADPASNAVSTADLRSDAVSTADLRSDAVSTADPASNAVSTADPASDAVSTADLRSDAVSTTDLASDAVSAADLRSDAVSTADPASNAVSTADPASDAVSTADLRSAPVSTAGRQQAVLPAPRAMTYSNLRPERQLGVAMELDQTADGAALWAAYPDPADHFSSVLDQFPFDPSQTRDEHSTLRFDGIDSAFEGSFFNSFPDKPFPLEDVVIPDFYFVDEFDTTVNSIERSGSIEGKSSEPYSLVVL